MTTRISPTTVNIRIIPVMLVTLFPDRGILNFNTDPSEESLDMDEAVEEEQEENEYDTSSAEEQSDESSETEFDLYGEIKLNCLYQQESEDEDDHCSSYHPNCYRAKNRYKIYSYEAGAHCKMYHPECRKARARKKYGTAEPKASKATLESLAAKKFRSDDNLKLLGMTTHQYEKIRKALYKSLHKKEYPRERPNEWTEEGGHLDQRALFTLFEAKYNCAPITHLLVGAQKYDTKLLHESINPSFNVSILSLGPLWK